jgi:hypothetical protein
MYGKRGVHAARNGPSADRKCWQRARLGIHGLNRWTVKSIEKSRFLEFRQPTCQNGSIARASDVKTRGSTNSAIIVWGLNVARGGWPVPPIRTGLRARWTGHDGFPRVLVSPDNDGRPRKATRRISQHLENAPHSIISCLPASFFLDTSRSKSSSVRSIGDFRLVGM